MTTGPSTIQGLRGGHWTGRKGGAHMHPLGPHSGLLEV